MTNEELKQLCLSLLHADAETEVIQLLQRKGFWDDPELWRYYGDTDGNYSIIGSQQSRPEAALVEKIVNSVDALLMNECWLTGVMPPTTSHSVPKADSQLRKDYLPSLLPGRLLQ